MNLIDAIRVGDIKAIKTQLAAGANVNQTDIWGITPLMNASRRNNAKIVKVLLSAGADVNQTDKEGRTALIWASYKSMGGYENDKIKTIRALLRAGADLSIEGQCGETALSVAYKLGPTKITQLLEKVKNYELARKNPEMVEDIQEIATNPELEIERGSRNPSDKKASQDPKAKEKRCMLRNLHKSNPTVFRACMLAGAWNNEITPERKVVSSR